ncbi:7888_t:CDS:2 [Funneliformis geosporum]|nr:7888_t:CDS:2 [Funneliformis geosporum]
MDNNNNQHQNKESKNSLDVDSISISTLSPYPSPCPSPSMYPQDDNGDINKMNIANNNCESTKELTSRGSKFRVAVKGAHCIAQSFEEFCPVIKTFFSLGNDILLLYEKAEHNKELCSVLLKRCNCAIAAVNDLIVRKTENKWFFSKNENLILFKEFTKCMKKIKKFIENISHLNKLQKFFQTNDINETFKKLTTEFDAYMNSLQFSMTAETRDDLATIKDDVSQMKDILLHVHGVTDNQQGFLNGMDLVTEKNKEFQKQSKSNSSTNSPEFITNVEAKEPLLNISKYQRTDICPSKRINKRTTYIDCTEVSFKEFSNTTSSEVQTQIEIRRQVNILKELKNSDHIIRFFGVAQEDSKFYLVTEWMEHGNLFEYYTTFKDNMNWETKIRFALDICRGVAYLHECEARIANFGLSKKFSESTRNISHNLENISVGALLWEIAELKKPHSDLNKSEILGSIRKRIQENYYEPFSDNVPGEWKQIVSTAMEYERDWRSNISVICRQLYKLQNSNTHSRSHSGSNFLNCENEILTPSEDNKVNLSAKNNQSATTVSPSITINILATVDDAIREHKSNNGIKLVAWNSFKYHSMTSVEAKYWVGYYYFYHGEDIPELQSISKKERTKYANEIFKETADKGNSSAQLRYGMHLWQETKNYIEGFKYLQMSADSKDDVAMYIVGKVYWGGIHGIEQDKTRGAEYLKSAALANNSKAKELYNERTTDDCESTKELTSHGNKFRNGVKGAHCIAQSFEEFCPIIKNFISLGNEIVLLYEKAEYNKKFCSILLKRVNSANAAVKDLEIRKTENQQFFSKQENLILFKSFTNCIREIRNFIEDISYLSKLQRIFQTYDINETFNNLSKEFDGYMSNLLVSIALESRNDVATIKDDVKEILKSVHGVSDDNQQKFPQRDGSKENEPLLDGSQYRRTKVCRSKRIEKRTSSKNCTEVSFKEFSNNASSQIQKEVRVQVNILKELKNSDHIIRFFGVAQDDSKFYLVTEWMEHGNLHEYYTKFKENMNWETKKKFALDICRGVAYLHECEVRIANFGLSKKFSDATRSISHNLENISVGALLWEIAELKKPHSDLHNSEILNKVRKRIRERYYEPFSNDVPHEWKRIVSAAMVYERDWRSHISAICRDLYELTMEHQSDKSRQNSGFSFPNNENEASTPSEDHKVNLSANSNQSAIFSSIFTILSVDDAIHEHKSNNKQVAWNNFKFHSMTSVEAKYWVGYYYYYNGDDIPELQPISEEERTKYAIEIFKETADKGNSSAQLRYGMHLWQKEKNYIEGLKYLKMSADSKDAVAMYIVGKAYWNGINGIEIDKTLGAEYLKRASLNGHTKAKELCNEYEIS